METRMFFKKLQTHDLLYLKHEIEAIIEYKKDKNYTLIGDTNLSVRALNVLHRAGIRYVEEFATLKRIDCLKWRNCGWRSMKEFEDLLKEYGLKWIDEESVMNVYEVGVVFSSESSSTDNRITVKANSFNHAKVKVEKEIGRGEIISWIKRL